MAIEARNTAANITARRRGGGLGGWALPGPISRFGATSPPLNNFRNRVIGDLEDIDENGSQDAHRRSPMPTASPSNLCPTGSPPNLLPTHLGGDTSAFEHHTTENACFNFLQRKQYITGNTPLTDAKLGELYKRYLHGTDGFDNLARVTPEFLAELGFEGDEAYMTILQGLLFIYKNEDKPDINPKYYAGFHKCEDLSVKTFVDFYAHLVLMLKRFGIGLLGFDLVLPKWLHIGLVYPGMGEEQYLQMSEPLFNLLEKLLPLSDPIVNMCTSALVGSNHDGFLLLRNVMAKCIPVFCSYMSIVLHHPGARSKTLLTWLSFSSFTFDSNIRLEVSQVQPNKVCNSYNL